MALDLFVNFERQSNNSLFYRETSTDNYTVFIKLSDQSLDNFVQLATANFIAECGLNNDFKVNYDFLQPLSAIFVRNVPCISSIQVSVSSIDGTLLQTFEMSAKFVDQFPTADFIAYPSSYFDEVSSNIVYLSASNYFEGPGVFFYGEGHTEQINLSASPLQSGISAAWIIGKNFDQTTYSVSAINVTTAIVSISSELSQSETIPISLKLYSNQFPATGPAYGYNDLTGEKEFYPLFVSTANVNGDNLVTNTTLKDSIQIKPYPHISHYKYNSPFSFQRFNLPYDYTNQTFIAGIETLGLSSILTERLNTTKWEIDTTSRSGDWNWSKTLNEIYIYYFPLAYDVSFSEVPAFFKCSPDDTTTVSHYVTATKFVRINYPPFDWKENTQTETFSAQCLITPIPFIKPYIPNYLNLRNEQIEVRSLEIFATSEFSLQRITLYLEDGPMVFLSGQQVNQPFTISFEKLGTKNLSAVCTFFNTSINEEQTVINVFPDIVKIVDEYDQIDLQSYRSKSTPLTLSVSSVPLISPNEWVVEDNINNIFEKLYQTITEINDYTTLYNTTAKVYGWLGNPNYAWSDVACPPNVSDEVAWKQHEICTEPGATAGYPIYWLDHECTEQIGDPSCLQKYCLEWKWIKRKRTASDVLVTWESSKCSEQYAKKWEYESCEVDNEILNCDKGKWHISTIDPDFFPIPFCLEKPRCKIKGLIELEDNSVVVAHNTELNLLDGTYQSTLIARRGIADEIYSFANIQAIDQLRNQKICVLDSIIPRVCVYEVKNKEFSYFNSWGSFGLKRSLYGFNNPKDLYVTTEDEILITDSGNKCIKRYSSVGKHIQTIDTELFESSEPLSVCKDSNSRYHILFEQKVVVLTSDGSSVIFTYSLNQLSSPTKINSSFNGETIYIAHSTGVAKYFNTGSFFEHVLNNYECADGTVLKNYYSIHQDSHRNLLISVEDKILKVVDHMELMTTRAPILSSLYWDLTEIMINKEEYVQPWVYLKGYHRLWDNVELLRNSLFYEAHGCKSYKSPTHKKEDLVIGQNEIVTNSTINRLTTQIWENIQSLTDYFNPDCKN